MFNKSLQKNLGISLVFAIAADSIILDQVVKWLILRGTISWPHNGVIDFTVLWNEGVAFGMQIPIYAWIIIVCLLGIVLGRHFVAHKLFLKLLPVISAGLILGGALSNSIDRLIHGAVLDFINLHWWPVFNLADSFIVIGALLMILWPDQSEGGA